MNLITVAALSLINFSSAANQANRKATSYRYGELASFEESMMMHKAMPDVWIRLHMPGSYKYGQMSKMSKEMRRQRRARKTVMAAGMAPSTSYKYGMKNSGMPMNMDKQYPMRKGMANGVPSSYRYGQKAMKMSDMKKDSPRPTFSPHPPFKGNKAITSYEYGRKHAEKKAAAAMMNKLDGNSMVIVTPRMLANIMAFRDMPVKTKNAAASASSEMDMIMKPFDEMDMIIKPLSSSESSEMMMNKKKMMKPKVSRNTERRIEFYQDSEGKLRQAEQRKDVMDLEFGPRMKQRIVGVRGFDGMDTFIEGEFMVLSTADKPNFNSMFFNNGQASSPMSAASLKDNFDEWKDKIDLSNEWVRAGVSVALGLLLTLTFLIFFKVLFRLWVKLGSRRREDDENRNLLKGELDSIHPISIVYKN